MFETETIESDAPAVERSEEFEAFRRLVRSRAIMARDSMGWPTDHLNQTLVTLGLEPIQEYSVVIEVTATNTYSQVFAANRRGAVTSQEEALRQVGEITDRVLAANLPYDKWVVTEKTEPRVVLVGVEGVEPDPAALGTDLDAYKKLVRRVGIAASKVRGWCDSGTNEYLVALGLPRKQAFSVPVDATVVQRFHMLIEDAESMEEAQQMVADGGLLDPLETVRTNLGTGVREVLVTAVADLETAVRGDSDPTVGAMRNCGTYDPNRQWTCTRERGHTGQHIAGNGRRVLEVWPQEVPVPA
jgi:hypothetical protein